MQGDSSGPALNEPPNSPIRLTPDTEPLTTLDNYNSKIGQIRSIKKEVRTLQVIQSKKISQGKSLGAVPIQIEDASSRLDRLMEERDYWKQLAILQYGTEAAPSDSADSSDIECFSGIESDADKSGMYSVRIKKYMHSISIINEYAFGENGIG
jgi:hypothetical protein